VLEGSDGGKETQRGQVVEGLAGAAGAEGAEQVSPTIGEALERCHHRSPARELIAATAFEIALDQLV
jgi:hypothetical protein